jgi:hypothetical protein
MIFIVPATEAQIPPQVKFLPQLENQLQPENVQEINFGNGNDRMLMETTVTVRKVLLALTMRSSG